MKQSVFQNRKAPNKLAEELIAHAQTRINQGMLLKDIYCELGAYKDIKLQPKYPRTNAKLIDINYRGAKKVGSIRNVLSFDTKGDETFFLMHETPEQPRPALQWFADQMEQKLQENENKDGWKHLPQESIVTNLQKQYKALATAYSNRDNAGIIKHCTNLANYAMMLADHNAYNIGDVDELPF